MAIEGLRIDALDLQVAALRFFDAAGRFATLLHQATGARLPQPLRATTSQVVDSSAHVTLLWRSPSETWLLCADRSAFARVGQRLAAAEDGCLVDQTGGIHVFQVQGPRARGLLQRLGDSMLIPGLGEAHSGRLAEVHILLTCLEAQKFLLLVERVYADHLREWIRATLADS